MSRTALVLTGGGARGAYQAGAVHGIMEVCKSAGISAPFDILVGTSAGSVNAGYLAAHSTNLYNASKYLSYRWSHLRTSHIYYTSTSSFAKIALKWLFGLFTGGLYRPKYLSLLDHTPLFELIQREIPFHRIQTNIDKGVLHGVCINAIDYVSGVNKTFYQAQSGVQPWVRELHEGVRTELQAAHILASSAIPLLFSPVMIEDRFYGDGNVRQYHPFSPSIKLGARKIVVVGARNKIHLKPFTDKKISMGRVISTLLDTVLLDALDMDYERLCQINRLVSLGEAEEVTGSTTEKILDPIDVLMIRPSRSLTDLAREHAKELPTVVKFLIKGLGSKTDTSDIVSYLLFEPAYTKALIETGYNDALQKKDELLGLLAQ